MTTLIFRCPDKPNSIFDFDQFVDGEYLIQPKRDGYRAVIEFYENEIVAWSRHHKPLAISDHIIDALLEMDVPPGTALDGEWLKHRTEGPEQITIFGLLYWKNKWMGRKTEEERFEIVQGLTYPEPIYLTNWDLVNYEDFFQKTKDDPANEGVVLKHLWSELVGGRDESKKNPMWFKRKWRAGCDGQHVID